MPTQIEQDSDYPTKVASYLAHARLRKLPWGCIVSGGHLTFTTTAADRFRRADLGETAIRLLAALGVTFEQLSQIDDLPEETPAEDLLLALQVLRTPEVT